ncbi:MAG TPA: RHS repeat-associated core domain-containing protein [Promineifilum sp.]|nr:RHS repeat-associated core domain-containing protein [Promineifilum sp.]HRO90568.1 RHS repeat-associated core domain-containing protein [Promineifilum sp.]
MNYDYAYADHLGSITGWSDAAGVYPSNSIALHEPFGAYRFRPPASVNPGISDRGYTGHRMNNSATNDLGLIYMNARYYLPEIGRFISADTIVPEPSNPQSYNRYAYTYNNPVNYTDPSGHCIFGIDTAICVAAAIGAGVSLIVDYSFQAYDNYQAGMDASEALDPRNMNLSQLAGSTVAGGVGGVIAGPIGGLASKSSSLLARIGLTAAGGAIGGAVGGQAGNLTQATVTEISDYYRGHGFNSDELFRQATEVGFLDPSTMMLDASTGAAFAVAGESLRSIVSQVSGSGGSKSLPIIGFEPVLGKGIQGKIYYQNRELNLTPSQLQALLQALSQNSRDAAIDLFVEWFGASLLED